MTKLLNLISSGLEKMADETLNKRSSCAMFGEIELPDVLRSMEENKEVDEKEK